MKRALIIGLAVAACGAFASLARADAASVAFQVKHSGRFTARVITVNLNDPDVRVAVAVSRGGIGTREGFGSLLSRLQPVAALTGTHFGIKSNIPVSDLVVLGKRVNSGYVGTNFVVAENNRASFISRQAMRGHPAKYPTAIGAGPRLLRHGVFVVNPRAEGYKDPGLFGRRLRVAIGLTKHNKLLLVTVKEPLQFGELAWLMKDLGAVDAMAMDGGASSAQYYRGRALVHPGRQMTNLLVVYENPQRFRLVANRLAPGVRLPKTRVASTPAPLRPWPVKLTAASSPALVKDLRPADRIARSDAGWPRPPAILREERHDLEELLRRA